MRAVLDHVGIAVERYSDVCAFYRDELGLLLDATEVVDSQGVRVHFMSAGPAKLEFIEAVSPESAVTRYLTKRGPGLHHIALRVDDIAAALAHLKARGVRLIDEVPRPGAEGAQVAFLHPSAARGVLVELKQPAPSTAAPLAIHSIPFGAVQLTVLYDGRFRLDGGAMFGVVPRTLWERVAVPDDRNRIALAMRPLLVSGPAGHVLVDCGAGDKMTAKQQQIYAMDRRHDLTHALAAVGLGVEEINHVVATHLHFDHFGGATVRRGSRLEPTFANAKYWIRRAEWEDATHPHERNRASYLADDFVPLLAAGAVAFIGDGADAGELLPHIRVQRTGGHTGQHQIVYVQSDAGTAVFVADMIPTVAHLHDAWITGYDLFPMDTLAFKKAFIREAIEREYLIIFEHDPDVAAGYIREDGPRRWVEAAIPRGVGDGHPL